MTDTTSGFSQAERDAMKERAAELKAAKNLKGGAKREREFKACLDAIDALTGSDRQIAERFHVVVTEEAPELDPKTWYGFPSYARDGEVVAFVQPRSKFDTRYATIGFNDSAALDDGQLWPTVFAVTEVTPEVKARLRDLVRRAVSARPD